ncbi:serine protease [Streptomyces sp. NPDC048718]|uniref:serine protease n=1 Tax=Streptomyces sp. NPDC048718 TaxID=3365587 RepID=UPI003718450A
MNVFQNSPVPAVSTTTRRRVLRGLAVTTAATTAAVCLPAVASAASASPAAPRPKTGGTSPTYTLTLIHRGRTGAPTGSFRSQLTALSGTEAGASLQPYDESGTVTVQVPAGRYLLDSTISTERTDGTEHRGIDWLVRPRLDVDRDTTIVLDARAAHPVDIRPPVPDAEFETCGAFVEVTHEGTTGFANVVAYTPDLRIAHLGPATEAGAVRTWVDGYWSRPEGVCFLGYAFRTDRALDGLVRHPALGDLATLVVRAAAPASGAGVAFVDLSPSAGPSPSLSRPLTVPGSATFLIAAERGTVDVMYSSPADPEKTPTRYLTRGIELTAGATTVHTFDTPVFGPALDSSPGAEPAARRTGNVLDVAVPLLADGDGHTPSSPLFTAATTALYRDGALLGTRRGTPGEGSFTLPAGRASYLLTARASRPHGSVTAAWTFTSARTASTTEIPLSVVRFSPELAVDGTAPAGAASTVGVAVRGAAERSGVRSLVVSVSTDRGASWSAVPVSGGRIAFTTPGPGRTVSLRAELTDAFGNTLTQTHIDAYAAGAASRAS